MIPENTSDETALIDIIPDTSLLRKLTGRKQDREIRGKIFYDFNVSDSLRQAQTYATSGGYVASLPDIIRGKTLAPFTDNIWKKWYAANSEESVLITPQGNKVVLISHGNGLLANHPERIEQAFSETLFDYSSVLFTFKEAKTLLSGKLLDGTEIPLFPYSEFIKTKPQTRTYGIILDFDEAKKINSAYQKNSIQRKNKLAIARAGGEEQLNELLKKSKDLFEKDEWSNRHQFDLVDSDQPHGRLLCVFDTILGLLSVIDLVSYGRFVGVAPETHKGRLTLINQQDEIHTNEGNLEFTDKGRLSLTDRLQS